jgi:hypothetical protein
MNCEQANQIDLVDYLFSLGYSPSKINSGNYWYLSPFRAERTASFKVNKSKNVWFDHGTGKGGKLIEFACTYFNCSIADVLQKISGQPAKVDFSFNQQKANISLPESEDRTIQIISVKSPIIDHSLIRYLDQRNIDLSVANQLCKEVRYKVGENSFYAIGFKNNCGGYELRSERFKGSASPKYVTWFNHQADSICVFEGFFDFLSWCSIAGKDMVKSNILVLNSLSFFARSLLLMEKHEKIHLYLDNDKAGKESVQQAMQRTKKVIDESSLYREFKDLNEWLVRAGKPQQIVRARGLRP